jgi:hypothetical protein
VVRFHSARTFQYKYESGQLDEGSTTVVSGHSFQRETRTKSASASAVLGTGDQFFWGAADESASRSTMASPIALPIR